VILTYIVLLTLVLVKIFLKRERKGIFTNGIFCMESSSMECCIGAKLNV